MTMWMAATIIMLCAARTYRDRGGFCMEGGQGLCD
jgi:hypothetical protein